MGKVNLFELSAEITGISNVIAGLSNQLDRNISDSLTPKAMGEALYGITCHLDRIAAELLDASEEA
jgi:hypothetical protein